MSLKTFRDPHVSRWQAVVDDLLHRREKPSSGLRHTLDHPVVAAATEAAATHVSGAGTAPGAPGAPAEVSSSTERTVAECAHLALKLATAKLERRPAEEIQRLEDELRFSTCDPLWSEAVTEHVKFFQLGKGMIPYRPASGPDDPPVIPLAENATVALIADWGTGMHEARVLLEKVAAHRPDVVIHLGDVYYAGTESENMKYLLTVCNEVFGRGPDRPLPIFNLTGNHDMYSGGAAYYAMLDQLNQPPLAQPGQLQRTSFFCLRSSGWQLLALDTSLHDDDVFDVNTSETWLEDSELAWHKHQIATAAGRRTILLSHHQLFSAFSGIGAQGDRSMNTRLLAQFEDVLGEVDAWLWGHEHNLEIYAPYAGLARGRCIGCSAVPVFVTQEPYKSRVGDKIPLVPADPAIPGVPAMLGTRDGVYNHAYVILKLDDATKTARVSYWEDTDSPKPLYEEVLGV